MPTTSPKNKIPPFPHTHTSPHTLDYQIPFIDSTSDFYQREANQEVPCHLTQTHHHMPCHKCPTPDQVTYWQVKKMRAELLADPNSSVQTRENARSFLDKSGFLLKEDPLSQEAFSYTLISLSHSAPMKMMQEGKRAIAILMMDEAAHSTGTVIMQYVEK